MIELDKRYIGNACEITNMKNEIICTGKLQELPNPDNSFMLSIVSRTGNFPVLAHRTILKVHVRNTKLGSIFLGGKIEVAKSDLIQLQDTQILATSEKRDAFRVKFEHNASIRIKREPRPVGVIRFQDISMGGFMCRTKEELRKSKVYTVQLPIEEGIYLFDFQVVRSLPSNKDEVYVYGCQFLNIGDKQMDTLARFVFSLQKESISKLQE